MCLLFAALALASRISNIPAHSSANGSIRVRPFCGALCLRAKIYNVRRYSSSPSFCNLVNNLVAVDARIAEPIHNPDSSISNVGV